MKCALTRRTDQIQIDCKPDAYNSERLEITNERQKWKEMVEALLSEVHIKKGAKH